tara:strand:+ start:1541 stop:1744 length:204 start_codon:yes stop_codon:yes gene_type:complete
MNNCDPTLEAIFNAQNQIALARAYINSVDDTEAMEVCAKRGLDILLQNATSGLSRHVEILMDEKQHS